MYLLDALPSTTVARILTQILHMENLNDNYSATFERKMVIVFDSLRTLHMVIVFDSLRILHMVILFYSLRTLHMVST